MINKNEWQKIEDWLVKNMKKGPNGLPSFPEKQPAVRPEPELDYQYMLEEASKNMIRFKRPEHLIRMIVRTIDEQVRTSHTAMLVYSDTKNYFSLVDSKGLTGNKIPVGFIRIMEDNPLIRVFNERHNFKINSSGALTLKELKLNLSNDPSIKDDNELMVLIPEVIKQMELLKSVLCVPVYHKKRILGVLLLGRKISNKKFSRQEISFFTTLANDVGMALSNAQLIQELNRRIEEVQLLYAREHSLFLHTAISLAAAIDARDAYTHGHTERVTRYAQIISEELESLPEAKQYSNFKETLHVASLLHDVGKIGVPDSILKKTAALTKQEYEKVKEHTIVGAIILAPIRELGEIAREIRAHHERFDGKGYPDGLKGDDIPFISRIIAVADTFDAITSDRPYRQAQLKEVAVQIVSDNSGTQFDPIIVSAFLLAYRKGKL
ncbi:MAG: HD domain-containing protein [Candidatus Omnitrophica bacterium]|nr:HD domain-containing protein [Candidatus Omnitrophota bacterium]